MKVFSKTKKTDFCRMRSLSRKEELVKSAFTLENNAAIRGKHILLLDDVLNSGTTVNGLTGMLERAGVKKTEALVLSQTR